jgi:hypothetical protein
MMLPPKVTLYQILCMNINSMLQFMIYMCHAKSFQSYTYVLESMFAYMVTAYLPMFHSQVS